MASRMEQLEYTVMELGTEMYRLKHRMADMNNIQEDFIKILKGLKAALDEKGILTSEDFEVATDLINMAERAEKRPSDAELSGCRGLAKKEYH